MVIACSPVWSHALGQPGGLDGEDLLQWRRGVAGSAGTKGVCARGRSSGTGGASSSTRQRNAPCAVRATRRPARSCVAQPFLTSRCTSTSATASSVVNRNVPSRPTDAVFGNQRVAAVDDVRRGFPGAGARIEIGGPGESTTDTVWAGHSLIAENGSLLAETERFRFETMMAVADVDVQRLTHERLHDHTFGVAVPRSRVPHGALRSARCGTLVGRRAVDPAAAFAHAVRPGGPERRASHCQEIFSIQSVGLAKRLRHTATQRVTIGVSGGLDSTLALLVTAKAFDLAGLPRGSSPSPCPASAPPRARAATPSGWPRTWARRCGRSPSATPCGSTSGTSAMTRTATT